MFSNVDLFACAKWLAVGTVVSLLVAIAAFIFGWGWRFRLVGVTSFMGVLTAGFFALGLGLFPHAEIPGAVRYSLIYDNGANQAVVAVSPEIEKSAIEPTLIQAATDLYSYGRTGTGGNDRFTVKLRTILHPQPGVSQPLFLGTAQRSITSRSSQDIEIKVFEENLAQLPPLSSTNNLPQE